MVWSALQQFCLLPTRDTHCLSPAQIRTVDDTPLFVLQDHVSFTCIGQYYAFNEGWGQYDTQRIVQMGHSLDSSRLWGAASGWIDPQDRTADQLVKTYQHYNRICKRPHPLPLIPKQSYIVFLLDCFNVGQHMQVHFL